MSEVIRRKLVCNRVTRLEAEVMKHDTTPLTAAQVKYFRDILTAEESKFYALHEELVKACVSEADAKIQEAEAITFEVLVQKTRLKLMEIQDAFPPTLQQNPQPNLQDVRLPRIDLPNFDGDFNDWVSFRDMFLATVHNAPISGAKKMQYLKSSLKGSAANLIKSMQITDQHYDQAWKTITERYNNTRELLNSILQRLFSQPFITRESAATLQQLLDTTNECKRSLMVLGRPVDTWDDMLVYLVVERMDSESRRRWIMQLQNNQIPTYKDLTTFLEQYIRGLLAGGQVNSSCSKPVQQQQFKSFGKKITSSHHGATAAIASSSACPICNLHHAMYKCEKFLALSLQERSNQIKKCKLCFNCLRVGHNVKECKSEHSCKKCGSRHNTLLHTDKSSSEHNQQNANQPSAVASLHTGNANHESQVLLATAIAKIKDNYGATHDCRILLGSGSESSFVSESCVSTLGLPRTKSNVTITGIGASHGGTSRGQVRITIISRINSEAVSVNALVLPKVTGNLPRLPCSTTWNHTRNLQLADPHYHTPGPIDVLLGADHFASIMRSGRRIGAQNSPVAQETTLGWILSGPVCTGPARVVHVNVATCETDAILQKFWEIEEMPAINHLTPEEKQCEEHFKQNHSRDTEGRYVVSLPTTDLVHKLGRSRQAAVSRLLQVERRLSSQAERKHQYIKFMREFQSLNHMELVPAEELSQQQGKYFYLPHHCVIKDSSLTTKLRVVFDGSCKSSTGVSLNECMMVGPTVQKDLYSLLLRFRTHPVALKADITKMYRQFKLSDQDKDFHRIVWRETPDQPIQDYRLLRVTYGTASAPYLATRCLNQLSTDEAERFPVAAPVLANNFYVDDLLSGEASTIKAIILQQQLTELLKTGGMELCKWSSNDPDVLKTIPADQRETELPLSFDPDSTTKALGVQWHPSSDTFQFKVSSKHIKAATKRACLSELAKVFDPMGFLAPTTIRAKILFQDLWKFNLSWDDPLPEDVDQDWTNYMQQLKLIEHIQIPRCLSTTITISEHIHGFSDASEKAYSAVLYLRSEQSDGTFNSRIITSKTKVAPIKQVSLPKLELCGSLLLSRLMSNVKKAIQFTGRSFAWTDSTIVLQWLAALPVRWKTFVANRVAEIQELTASTEWHHVKSEENPADCASRGISAAELRDFDLWWTGPSWLCSGSYPEFTYTYDKEAVEAEARKQKVTCVHAQPNGLMIGTISLLDKYSSLSRLLRVTAYVFRFSRRQQTRLKCELTVAELQDALHYWIRMVQQSAFSEEIRKLNSKGKVKTSSKLLSLAPFIDSNGILRVGGRLHKSNLPEDTRHQIILPTKSQLTTLIIRHHHNLHLHAGPQLLLSTLHQQYWIPRGRDAVRAITGRCIVCRRHKAQATSQLMGSLPAARVTPSRPFLKCGLDYAGPIQVKVLKGRGHKQFKAYICIFVCLATKAVHLEAVSDMTTDAFIGALKRFTSRRGVSSDLFSDCGSNFLGADTELKSMLESSTRNSNVSKYC